MFSLNPEDTAHVFNLCVFIYSIIRFLQLKSYIGHFCKH